MGTDIVQISRISHILQKNSESFLRKVLHKMEIEEYSHITLDKKKNQFVAGRWAVKEALVKATGDKSIIYSKVIVQKDARGQPSLVIEKHDAYSNKEIDDSRFLCSISHEDEYATAVVIMVNNKL